ELLPCLVSLLPNQIASGPLVDFLVGDATTAEIYTLSLHDALPIWRPALFGRRAARSDALRGAVRDRVPHAVARGGRAPRPSAQRSEEHTSELQSPCNLVCRLLLEKKKLDQIFTVANCTFRILGLCW